MKVSESADHSQMYFLTTILNSCAAELQKYMLKNMRGLQNELQQFQCSVQNCQNIN